MTAVVQIAIYLAILAVVAVAMYERGVNDATERLAAEIEATEKRAKAERSERARRIAAAMQMSFAEALREADLFMERDRQIDAHASARIIAARSPEPEHKARVIESKRDVDVVAAAIAARKLQISILQSLLRSGI